MEYLSLLLLVLSTGTWVYAGLKGTHWSHRRMNWMTILGLGLFCAGVIIDYLVETQFIGREDYATFLYRVSYYRLV